MPDKIDINAILKKNNPELSQQVVQNYFNSLDLGLLGKIFGRKESAEMNILGVILIALVATLVIFLFCGTESESLTKKDILTFLLPAITTIIGYLVGKGKKE